MIVFFFQAEDGIRDRNVTGVQTCALPICRSVLRLPVRVPLAARDFDQDPGLRRPGVLAGHQAAVAGAIPLVAARGDGARTASAPGAVVVCGGERGFGGRAGVAESELKKVLAF